MKSFEEFIPLMSKTPKQTMACYRGYQLGYIEGKNAGTKELEKSEKKLKDLNDKLKELYNKL